MAEIRLSNFKLESTMTPRSRMVSEKGSI